MNSKSPDKELKERSFEFIELTLNTLLLPGVGIAEWAAVEENCLRNAEKSL